MCDRVMISEWEEDKRGGGGGGATHSFTFSQIHPHSNPIPRESREDYSVKISVSQSNVTQVRDEMKRDHVVCMNEVLKGLSQVISGINLSPRLLVQQSLLGSCPIECSKNCL